MITPRLTSFSLSLGSLPKSHLSSAQGANRAGTLTLLHPRLSEDYHFSNWDKASGHQHCSGAESALPPPSLSSIMDGGGERHGISLVLASVSQ